MSLIGYEKFANQTAKIIKNFLTSSAPYSGFSVRGARRSGRSSFFEEVAKKIESSGAANCFTGDLSTATREGFEATLLNAISSDPDSSIDCDSFRGKVQSPDGFFELCTALNRNENVPPVFLIDMGEALERAYDERGMEGVNDLSRLLRQIFNLLKERNVKVVIGIGLTIRFVDSVKDFSRDVYIDRYKNVISLTNSQVEGEPSACFRQIVRNISEVKIPENYGGLWRGHTVTAGQLAENLKSRGVTSVSSEMLWQNLHGQWRIVENIHHPDITEIDLGELLLADAVIPENRYPNWLEECDGGYRATDALYSQFGLISPQKDPSKLERIQRRVNDPDDEAIAKDILNGLCEHMRRLGLSDLNEAESLGQKSAVMEAKLESNPDESLTDLERDLCASAFPRKLLIVSILTGDPAEEELKRRIEECNDQQGFLLVLHKAGVDFSGTPLTRFLANIPHSISVISTEQQIAGLLSDEIDSSLTSEVSEWISTAVQKRLNDFPPLCVSHPIIKRLINGAIQEGVLDIAGFAGGQGITQADARKCLKFLTSPSILTANRGQVSWDPDKDVILSAVMEHKNDEVSLGKELCKHYTVNQIDSQALIDLYQGITGNEGLEKLTNGRILKHARSLHRHNLDTIENILENESELAPELIEKCQAYCQRSLERLSEVASFTKDILELLGVVNRAKQEIIERRAKIQQELEGKKESFGRNVAEKGNYFSDDEREQILKKLNGVQTLESKVFRQTEKRINERVELVDWVTKRVDSCANRLARLGGFLTEEESTEIAKQLDSIRESIDAIFLDGVRECVEKVDAALTQVEEKRDQQAILTGRDAEGNRPPTLQGGTGEGNRPPTLQGGTGEGNRPPALQGGTGEGNRPPALQGGTAEGNRPPTLQGGTGENVQAPPQVGTIAGPPTSSMNATETASGTSQRFDLADPTQRKELVECLVLCRNSRAIAKIEVTLGD